MKNRFDRSTVRMFFLWLLFVPAGVVYTFINYFPKEINWSYLLCYVMLSILVSCFPIIKRGKPVFMVMWVALPVFLMYGLFIEILVMQISVLALIFARPSQLSNFYRFFLNSLLFMCLSIISASVFYLLGGETGMLEFAPLVIAALSYQLTHTGLNDLVLRLYVRYPRGTSPYLTKETFFEFAIVFMSVPFSLTLYYLLQFVEIGAFFLLSAPYFFMVIIIRLHNNTEKINEHLQRAGEIGYGLADEVSEKAVIDQFVANVSKMFGPESLYLFDYKDGWLELIRSYEQGDFQEIVFNRLAPGQGLVGLVLDKKEPLFFGKREEWQDQIKDYMPEEMQSIICLPIVRDQKVEAVLLLASSRKEAFKEYQLKILDILTSYFTVSVEKARRLQETVAKSNRCSLTKLYNYRFLEERLEYEMALVNKDFSNELSILMLDIDYFKKVNDAYGHQSGNDILYNLARVFEEMNPSGGIIARYGGEEFVYLLPGFTKEKAMEFAEELRSKVESFGFRITPDLGESSEPIDVHITISVGVSTAPEDTDEAKSLLRNADRSLYLWAKEAGRNRVAGYVK